MWHAMFIEQIPVAEKILRTVLVYALIAVLFRLTGKRGLSNMSTFDFVVIFLLSNVVQNAVIGNDSSLIGGVVGAVTLVMVNTVVNRLIAVSATAARIFDGRPTTVIRDGHVIQRALGHLGVRRSELDHAVRMQNGDDVSEIQDGVLEPGGQLVLSLKAAEQGATKADVAELATSSAGSRPCSARLPDRRPGGEARRSRRPIRDPGMPPGSPAGRCAGTARRRPASVHPGCLPPPSPRAGRRPGLPWSAAPGPR